MHYNDFFNVIVGNGLIFFTLGIIALFCTLICVPRIFNFPQLGSLFDIMMFITPYLLACIFLGMTLSCIIKGREEPLLFYVFVSVPLLFLSGMTWPWCSIPPYLKYPGCLVPSTFAIQGFIQMGSCGATLANIRFYYLFEWALAGFYFVTAMIVYRRHMKLSEIYA